MEPLLLLIIITLFHCSSDIKLLHEDVGSGGKRRYFSRNIMEKNLDDDNAVVLWLWRSIAVLFFIIMICNFITESHRDWKKDFKMKGRLSRSHRFSPSSLGKPPLPNKSEIYRGTRNAFQKYSTELEKTWFYGSALTILQSLKTRTDRLLLLHRRGSGYKRFLSHSMRSVHDTKSDKYNTIGRSSTSSESVIGSIRPRQFRRLSLDSNVTAAAAVASGNNCATSTDNENKYGLRSDPTLDMDHIYISFGAYIWAKVFIGNSVVALTLYGLLKLKIRVLLYKFGFVQKKPMNAAEVAAKLVLEQTQVIHYIGKFSQKNDNDEVPPKGIEEEDLAAFSFPNFPILQNNGTAHVADLLFIVIDLNSKQMVSANLDGDMLTAEQAIILLWFNTVFANHVKIHSYANWGVNLGKSKDSDVDVIMARNSLVTVYYNFIGYSIFPTLIPTFQRLGFLSVDCSSSMKQIFDHGISSTPPEHSKVVELMQKSRFVKFITLCRPIFLKKFNRHFSFKDNKIDAEALFIGTVLHSLDHTLASINLEDPLWLDTSCPRFGAMAEMGRLVKAAFVDDLPFLPFNKRFQTSGHPFFVSVYNKASKVDKFLADHMDVCIVK